MPHVPDTVPGKRVTGAGARTEGREASRQTSEVGAVCGQAARTVLCGGRSAMGVPTAIFQKNGVRQASRHPGRLALLGERQREGTDPGEEGPEVRIRFLQR